MHARFCFAAANTYAFFFSLIEINTFTHRTKAKAGADDMGWEKGGGRKGALAAPARAWHGWCEAGLSFHFSACSKLKLQNGQKENVAAEAQLCESACRGEWSRWRERTCRAARRARAPGWEFRARGEPRTCQNPCTTPAGLQAARTVPNQFFIHLKISGGRGWLVVEILELYYWLDRIHLEEGISHPIRIVHSVVWGCTDWIRLALVN